MKLKSISVKNYRSIVNATKLSLDSNLTVILGPNNEGKSNLLRAIQLALTCLKVVASPDVLVRVSRDGSTVRLPRGLYDWDADFPRAAQDKSPEGQSIFTLGFELSREERARFRSEIGSQINEWLPIEVAVGHRQAQVRIRKQGKSSAILATKSKEIAEFVGRHFEFEYIPALRPSQMSLEVIANLIERELSSLQSNDEYQSALKTIEELQRPVYDQLEQNVSTYLKQLLPSVRTVKIGPARPFSIPPRYRFPQFIVDDGTATDLDAKGDGVKSLVAISLVRAIKAGGTAGDLVVAIEEPEAHLHPDAIRQLAIVLQDIAKEHQVIITTHSPLLVVRNRIRANIIVSNSRATPAESIREIRDALGVRVGDNLESAEFVVLVEGTSDALILGSLFRAVCPELGDLIETGKVTFDTLDGTGKVGYKVSSVRLIAATPILIVDGDEAGRRCIRKARADGGMDDRFMFCIRRSDVFETELEDIINPDCYWSSLENEFGVSLDRKVYDSATGKWSDRMRAAFEAGGKSWVGSLESSVKQKVAACVQDAGEEAILSHSRALIESIARAVLGIVNSVS